MTREEAIECLKEISGVYVMEALAGDKDSEKKVKALLYAIARLEIERLEIERLKKDNDLANNRSVEKMERLEILLHNAINEVMGM